MPPSPRVPLPPHRHIGTDADPLTSETGPHRRMSCYLQGFLPLPHLPMGRILLLRYSPMMSRILARTFSLSLTCWVMPACSRCNCAMRVPHSADFRPSS